MPEKPRGLRLGSFKDITCTVLDAHSPYQPTIVSLSYLGLPKVASHYSVFWQRVPLSSEPRVSSRQPRISASHAQSRLRACHPIGLAEVRLLLNWRTTPLHDMPFRAPANIFPHVPSPFDRDLQHCISDNRTRSLVPPIKPLDDPWSARS